MCSGGVTVSVDVVNIQSALPTLLVKPLPPSAPMSTSMNKIFIPILLALLTTLVATVAPAQSAPREVTLDQAVSRVQADTGGKVLSAEPRHIGRRSEYRIKVLTPAGHVRVIVVPSEPRKNPASTPAIKNPPARHMGIKEKR